MGGGDNTGVTTLLDQTSDGHDGALNNFALNGSNSNWVGSDAFASCAPANQDPDCSNAAIADQSADANCGAAISAADVTGDACSATITVSVVDDTAPALSASIAVKIWMISKNCHDPLLFSVSSHWWPTQKTPKLSCDFSIFFVASGDANDSPQESVNMN